MRIGKWLISAVLAVMPMVAQAEIVDCAVTPDAHDNGWLGKRYIFQVDAAKGTVQVDDGLIEYYAKGPIDGKLVKNTATQLIVAWELITVSSTGQRTKMTFRGTYFRALNQFQITSKPFGFSNVYDAAGTCTIG